MISEQTLDENPIKEIDPNGVFRVGISLIDKSDFSFTVDPTLYRVYGFRGHSNEDGEYTLDPVHFEICDEVSAAVMDIAVGIAYCLSEEQDVELKIGNLWEEAIFINVRPCI